MRRRRSFQVTQRYARLLPQIQPHKADHPFWGNRRIWAYQHCVEQLPVNKKRILCLMREHHLLVQPNPGLKAKRTPMARKPSPSKPKEWCGINMTSDAINPVSAPMGAHPNQDSNAFWKPLNKVATSSLLSRMQGL